MARSSSAKKVARAARAGSGRRSRQTGERNLLFPLAMAAVVVIGLIAVIWARAEREDAATPEEIADTDLRVAYGVFICDDFVTNLASDLDVITTAGVRTFGDGLFYVPSDEIGDATLGDAFDEADAELSDDAIRLPDGTSAVEGETTCGDDDVTGELRVVKWDSLLDDAPAAVVDTDLRDVAFDQEGQSITIAFVLPDTSDDDIPRPTSDVALADYLGIEVGASATTEPAAPSTTAAPTTSAG